MDGNLPEARDRLDQPIINAIEAKNYKQALKLVDKRLAKKSADAFLQVCAFDSCNARMWLHLSLSPQMDSQPGFIFSNSNPKWKWFASLTAS